MASRECMLVQAAASALLLLLLCSSSHVANAADADPILDYCVADQTKTGLVFNGLPCKASVTSKDFSSAAFRAAGNTNNPLGIGITFAAAGASFPALNTQGLALVRIDYAVGGFVPPHVHPRASEVVLVVQGAVLVGFVDTAGNYYSSTLYAGDLFVFPRGLVHFQLEVGNCTALSYSSLNSQNPGLSLVASALFGSTPSIPDTVLEKTFSLTIEQVESIKKAFH